jgi:subtilisin family serine protease
VKVAVIADQLDPHAPDFIRPDGSPVFVDYQDFSGTGTQTTKAEGEGFGDASLIAAQGTVVHDLSKFVNAKHPLPAGCTIVLRGVAPDASLVGLDWDNPDGTSDSSILQAIDYAVTVDHVDVINESLGGNVYPDNLARSAIRAFNDQAVRAGVTVVTATGDSGGTSTISNLATDPQVIAVGASTNFQAAMQASAGGTPLSNGKWLDNGIAPFSSSGISQAGRTIDLVAPGNDDWAACAPAFSGCTDFNAPPKPTDLLLFGGTSESAPITAGAAALVIQTYRNSHHGRTPTPAMVKELLTGTAHDLGMPSDEQGAGLLDARAAVDAARGQGSSRCPPAR